VSEDNKNIKLRLLSYVVIAYMLLAFTWWSVLLFTKNRDAFYAKRDLLKIGLIAERLIESDHEFEHNINYQELHKEYKRQEWMIFGEAAVFVVTLIIGIWLINRGYNREMLSAQQRRNFLLSTTHELKSPLASIKLVLETFIKRKLKPEQTEKLTHAALQETERLNHLVNDLLLSAKLEVSYQPNVEELNLAHLVGELIERLKTKYPVVEFQFHQNGSIPNIQADKMGMTSVSLNLLENAVKYSSDQPKIEVNLGLKNNKIILNVADNGIGISDKEKKRIFEKFYRVGNEDTRTTKGTGLGLFIVQQIIKAHEGTILVEDNEVTGTRFKIELPIKGVGKK
jgi:signal transduction histidine kinase